jgi:hypothetical protein
MLGIPTVHSAFALVFEGVAIAEAQHTAAEWWCRRGVSALRLRWASESSLLIVDSETVRGAHGAIGTPSRTPLQPVVLTAAL